MKRQLLFGLAVAVLLTLGQTVWAQPDGLVAYWPFDEGAGTTAADMSGNGNDGVVEGGATWIEGPLGAALQFNGSDAYVRAPYIPLNGISHTVAMWVNSPRTGGDQMVVFAQVQTNSQNLSLHYRVYNNGTVRMGFYSNDIDASGVLEADIWTHIAFVYDADSKSQMIYINGVQAAQRNAPEHFLGNTGDTRIGQWNNNQWFNGMIDDVQVYQAALTEAEILSIMDGLGDPAQASSPSPGEDVIDVPRDVVLAWNAGDYAVKHDVYLGSSYEDVNDATAGSALMIGQGLTDTSLDAGRLDFEQTYFWRVDEVNAAPDNTVFKGAIWSFQVEPHGRPITDITVTASSSNDAAMGPEKTIDGSGLNEMDQHSTAAPDMWLSGMGDATPSLEYAFDKAYKLDEMLVWNSNQLIESFIGLGAKDVVIETSLDGAEWTVLEGANLFNQAPGAATYEANTIIDFAGTMAQYVKITINAGWGMLPQYGLSEVRFLYIPTFAMEPEPADGSAVDSANVLLAWRAGREAASHEVMMGTDPADLALVATTSEASYAANGLDYSTTYYWSITEVNDAEAVTAHPGDVWSFTTPDFGTVDDFEQYDDNCNRIFFSWEDGLGHSGGEEIDDCDVPASNGNGGGSIVGNNQAPFAEKTIVNVGGSTQSLPFNYDNAFGDSYTTVALDGQDWTASAVKTLAIAFSGTEGNTGTLYVKINNTKILYDLSPADIAGSGWQAWNIDLTGVSGLQNVTSLTIGVDGASAAGMLYIDDIRLYPLAGELVTPANPGTDGLVAQYTFEGNANDSSGNGVDGTVEGGATFSPGKVGSALDCGGFDGFVSTGRTASSLGIDGNKPRTVTCWAYTRVFNNGGLYDVGARTATQDFCLRTMATDNVWRIQYWGGDQDFTLNTMEKWVHFTHVHDGTNTKIYADGLLIVDWAKTINTTDDNPWQIGCYGWQNDYFDGMIDELHLYNRALSPEEALFMAGKTQPVHKPF